MKREGIDVARCTVARLMRSMGLKGVVRGKPVKTTISDKATPCPLDRVNRQFQAPRPTGTLRGRWACLSFRPWIAIRQHPLESVPINGFSEVA